MRIAVYGAGGVGGFFGARLAQAGEEVFLIVRGAHLEAIRRSGLTVESPLGDFTAIPAGAEADPAKIGVVDVVVVGVKAWQVEEAARAMRPLVGPDTLVVPMQNGVEAPAILASALDNPLEALHPHHIGGLCRIISMVSAPGVIGHLGMTAYAAFNRLDAQPDWRVEALRAAFARARLDVEVPEDITAAMWAKFAFIAPFGGVGAVTRAPAGVLRSLPQTRQMLADAAAEIAAVGRARGVSLPADLTERVLAQIDALPEGGTASMQRDILTGRPSELDAQNGAAARLGRAAGVPVPLNSFLYAALLPQEQKARSEAHARG
jgi:2-dehydropantoate 2-reductase